MARAILLLPAFSRFGVQRLGEASARMLGRADATHHEGAQTLRLFDILPRGWPAAAVTRQADAGDAPGASWLRADPVHIRPDINGARLLAHGPALGLTARDVEAFLPALRPLFGDAGCPIDAPVPTRWYIRLPADARLPAFSSPDEALGDELFEHLPGAGEPADAPEVRRWRALLSEVQVVLHNHPRNAERIAAGQATVNSLWFWGGGRLPDRVRSPASCICSDDDTLRAFAALAGATTAPLRGSGGGALDIRKDGEQAIDLREVRDLKRLDADWLAPLLERLRTGDLDELVLDGADGQGLRIRRAQRWRFWRRPRPRLAP